MLNEKNTRKLFEKYVRITLNKPKIQKNMLIKNIKMSEQIKIRNSGLRLEKSKFSNHLYCWHHDTLENFQKQKNGKTPRPTGVIE